MSVRLIVWGALISACAGSWAGVVFKITEGAAMKFEGRLCRSLTNGRCSGRLGLAAGLYVCSRCGYNWSPAALRQLLSGA